MSTGQAEREPSPWKTIWTRPRRTVRRVVDSGRTRDVAPIAVLWGVWYVLDRLSGADAGDDIPLWAILAISSVAGPLSGLAFVYLGGLLLFVFGEWLEGAARPAEARAALAWSSAPIAAAALLWIPSLTLFGREMFTREAPKTLGNEASWIHIPFLLLGLADFVLMIWAFVLFLNCVAEVNRFSVGKAFVSGLLLFISVVLAISGVVIVVGILL